MDNDIALAEMLVKQDETTVSIKENNAQVKGIHTQIIETNNILRDFMGMSVKQWEQQQTFNEIIIGQLKEIKESVVTMAQVDARLKAIEEREQNLEGRLTKVENLLKAS